MHAYISRYCISCRWLVGIVVSTGASHLQGQVFDSCFRFVCVRGIYIFWLCLVDFLQVLRFSPIVQIVQVSVYVLVCPVRDWHHILGPRG